ncbi:leucine-rich repeat domain-containing protein [Paenibacillus sp. MBLB4367]|uniref:leucine-rich repeat domain-containing protein n=1 Tax=Paenibacillus sp. MBLB4367 TaxID=3384767 RepID=UPI00390814DD
MEKKRIMRFMISLALAAPLLAAGQPIAHVNAAADAGDQVVNFPDAKLKQALINIGVDTNGDGSITRKEMADRSDPLHMGTGLGTLGLGRQGITDLTGLEYAVNVTSLSLESNNLTDISPLAKMGNLETLSLDFNEIGDLSPLSGLSKLRLLAASSNRISDLRPLASMGSLEYIYFQDNKISDMSPLSQLKNLKIVQFFKNEISDLSPLSGLKSLQEINMRANRVSSLKALSSLSSVQRLFLSFNQIRDVSPLSAMSGLQELHLDINEIGDVTPLAGLTGLRELYLEENQVGDISALAGMTNLERLDLSINRISDVRALAAMAKMKNLYVFNNQISDISPLASLTALKEASLGSNRISDISAAAKLVNINALDLSGNQIGDVNPLSGLIALKELSLKNNRIGDVSPLAKLTNLELLDVTGNPIADASPLLSLKNLTKLDIDKKEEASLAPVVKGVSEGIFNTDKVITFDRGTATLNNKPFASGSTVSDEGSYTLFVSDKSGLSTTVHFVIDKKPPVVTGVEAGKTYRSELSITYNEGVATLNGKPFGNGGKVNADGAYTLVVTDEAGNRTTIAFTFEGNAPVVRGVSPGGIYNTERVITFDQGVATLDDMPFQSGGKVSAAGIHKLAVTGKDGKQTTIAFTIRKQAGEPSLPGASEWAKPDLAAASEIGLTLPVQDRLFTDYITRELLSEVAVKLYEALTGEAVRNTDGNPFQDTANPEVVKAYRLGIVSGTSDDRFSPDDRITREQLATMLKRALDKTGKSIARGEAIAFADRDSFSPYAREAIDFMSSVEVINGITDTTFGPKQNASIEQAVIMAKRLYAIAAPNDTAVPGEAGAGSPVTGGATKQTEQPAAGNTLFSFDGSQFRLYVQQTHPQPDGSEYKVYGYKNIRSFTLPAYCAIYLTAGTNYPVFEEDYYNYHFGGQLVIANHTDKPKVVKEGEIDASLERIYRDNMGTVGKPDGTSFTLKATGPYVRLIAFEGDFDETVPYKTYMDQKKDVFAGDWMTIAGP